MITATVSTQYSATVYGVPYLGQSNECTCNFIFATLVLSCTVSETRRIKGPKSPIFSILHCHFRPGPLEFRDEHDLAKARVHWASRRWSNHSWCLLCSFLPLDAMLLLNAVYSAIPPVCLSHAWIVGLSKRLNISSKFFHCLIGASLRHQGLLRKSDVTRTCHS